MHCFMIAAVSADGFLAENENLTYNQKDQEGAITLGRKTFWTSKEDGKFFRERTTKAGVVVMGRKTFVLSGRPLPGRLNIIYSSQASTLSLSDSLPENLRYTDDNPRDLLTSLSQEGYSELAICGGSSIYTQFLLAGVVDTIYLTVEPVFFGQGVKLFTKSLSAKRLNLKQVHHISEQTIVLEYMVNN